MRGRAAEFHGLVFDLALHWFSRGQCIKTCRRYWSKEIADCIGANWEVPSASTTPASPCSQPGSRVKSWRSKLVESENMGLSKRMDFSCTMQSAISLLQ